MQGLVNVCKVLSMNYKIKEAAKYLGVSAESLRRWEKQGLIKPMRTPVGSYRIYTKEQLDQFRELHRK